MAKDKELTLDEKFDLLIAALVERKDNGIDADTLKTILQETQKSAATAMQKALRPENETHPGISACSYPEGDRARPKQPPPYPFSYCGYPCSKFPETETWREWELMWQVQPGEYTVMRRDGSRMSVTVEGERDADGKLTKIDVKFPISREEKWLVPPKSVVLYQLVHPDNPKQRFMEAMQEYLQREFASVA